MTLQNKKRPRTAVQKILLAIMQKDKVSQPELKDLTNLSRMTISKALKELEIKRYIKFVRVQPVDKGRPCNYWKISFRGLLLVFDTLKHHKEELDPFIKRYEDEWVVFREWDYIAKDITIRLFVEYIISQYTSKKLMFLDALSLKDMIHNPYVNQKAIEREQKHAYLEQIDKHTLVRDILGLHRVFYSDAGRNGGVLEVAQIIPYLIKNPVFKELYVRELELLKLNYEQLMIVSEIIEHPDKAEQVTDKLVISKTRELRKHYISNP